MCTKVGLLKTPLAVAVRPAGRSARRRRLGLGGLARGGSAAGCYAPRYVTVALERSLRRLGRDRVELLLLHAPPLEVLARQEFLPALEALVRAGKVGHFGVSCATPDEADAALDVPGIACLQIPYSAARRTVLEHVGPRAAERGVGIMAAGPFDDSGLLGAEPAAPGDLLRFALAAPGVSSVLAGMSRAEHVEANVAAALAPSLRPARRDPRRPQDRAGRGAPRRRVRDRLGRGRHHRRARAGPRRARGRAARGGRLAGRGREPGSEPRRARAGHRPRSARAGAPAPPGRHHHPVGRSLRPAPADRLRASRLDSRERLADRPRHAAPVLRARPRVLRPRRVRVRGHRGPAAGRAVRGRRAGRAFWRTGGSGAGARR